MSDAKQTLETRMLAFLDQKIDEVDEALVRGEMIGAVRAMLALGHHPSSGVELAGVSKDTAFGATLTSVEHGIAPRFERLRLKLSTWLHAMDEAPRIAIRDRLLKVAYVGNRERNIARLLDLPLPGAPEPERHEGIARPDDQAQGEAVALVEQILARLAQSVDDQGFITDEAWVAEIRRRNDLIEDDEHCAFERPTPWSDERLDALEERLEKKGLFLPRDYRRFLAEWGGMLLHGCAPGEPPGSMGDEIFEGFISQPDEPEWPDEIPPRLVFFEVPEGPYFAIEFGDEPRIITQWTDWGGVPSKESRTISNAKSFADWLGRYCAAGCNELAVDNQTDADVDAWLTAH